MDSEQRKYWEWHWKQYPPSELGKPVRSYDSTFSATTVLKEMFFKGVKNEKDSRD